LWHCVGAEHVIFTGAWRTIVGAFYGAKIAMVTGADDVWVKGFGVTCTYMVTDG